MKRHFLVVIFILLILPLENSYAQFSIQTKGETYYDDNIFNNTLKVKDLVSSISISTAYDFESERNNLQFYYINNFSYFRDNKFKSSNSHKIGIVNTFLVAEDDNPLNVGINYSMRNNRDEFYIFDFNQLSLYANYRHSLNKNNYFILGYLFNNNNYKNLSMFSYNENKGFIKYSYTSSTKTALMTGLEIHIKNYLEDYAESGTAKKPTQLNFYLQLSKSLAEFTGISGYFLIRKNLNNNSRYIYSGDYIYYEEEIFTDLYSNEGYESGLSFTQLLSDNVIAKLEFIYLKKDFSNLPAASFDGYDLNENRWDKQYSLGAEIGVNLSSFINGLNASVNWNYIKNNSNDSFYSFDNQIFSFSFGWGF